jgi:hypothetical protein
MTNRIAQIRARLEAATPGEWRAYFVEGEDEWTVQEGAFYGDVCKVTRFSLREEPDAALIASAPADLAWCLGEIERLHVLSETRAPMCQCSDDEACKFVRERDAARAEVESNRAEIARLRALVAKAEDVVDQARTLTSYSWEDRLEDCRVSGDARIDSRELGIAVWHYDRAKNGGTDGTDA